MNPVLSAKVKSLPSSPGVYLMKDSKGNIIYVGKSKNLKKRVQSYFYHSQAHSPKVKKLVMHLKDMEHILTDTEFEAFMLECRLIKQLKPVYNRKMKNPQSYAYIAIRTDGEIRQIDVTHDPAENGDCLYFGPYPGKSTVERAVQGMKECFHIVCSSPSVKGTACLNYSLGLCIGVCLGGEAVDRYNEILDQIIALLHGSDRRLLEEIEQRMLAASEKYEFETAAKYRDYMETVTFLLNREKVIEFTEENQNIAVVEYLDGRTVKLLLIKGNTLLLAEKYVIEQPGIEPLCVKMKSMIRDCFKSSRHPKSIEVSRHEIDEAQIIYSYLQSSSCSYFIVPEQWLESEKQTEIDEALRRLLR